MTERVVVIGAGPAGMRAALSAADAGAAVLLVDSAETVGGQYHRQLPVAFRAARPDRIQHDWTRFTAVRDRIQAHPLITHLADSSVWAVEPANDVRRLRLQTGAADAPGRRTLTVDTPALVLATGAYDRVLPFPGWDLPGVYAAGAAQALANGQRIAVGENVLLSGTGPFMLSVAASLLGVGARLVGLLEANPPGRIARGWSAAPVVASGKVREAASYASLLARHRVPVKYRTAVVAAHGKDGIEAVTTARLDSEWNPLPGTERHVELDAVCLGFGFTARLELAVSAGCKIGIGPDGGPAVVVDEHQRTSVPGVMAAGELTGIGGADLASAEGTLAGLSAAAMVGRRAGPRPDTLRAVARGRRLAKALAAAYPLRSGWSRWLTDETIICRCEEVSYRQLRRAVQGLAARDTRAIKLTSRAGLGLCQGRVCGQATTEIAAELSDEITPPARAGSSGGATTSGPVPDPMTWARRPIALPVSLRDLAAISDTPTEEP